MKLVRTIIVFLIIGLFVGSIIPTKLLVEEAKADPTPWGIDTDLLNLINLHADDYYNSNWDISLSQYKSWITLISLREAGYGRYGAREPFVHRCLWINAHGLHLVQVGSLEGRF